MQNWNVKDITMEDGSRSPQVLHSQEGEARVVAIHLQAGQQLGDHEVKEAALVLVVDGTVRNKTSGESVDGTAGMLFRFEPEERHTKTTDNKTRNVLVLPPWPGQGHYRGE